uniref:receptor protein-tyrosine kinase n=1 Tax=Callorhinchus milii TaxID=7868 RepID=A0A4W3HSX0_CALMI
MMHYLLGNMNLNIFVCFLPRGSAPISWSWPNHIVNGSEKLRIIHFSCEDNDRLFCSNLTLNKALGQDTGYYSCNTISSNSSLSGKEKTQIYIFVKDENSPFVNPHTQIPQAVHMSNGKKLVIPCRVTAPDLKVSLKMFSSSSTVDGKEIKWDSKLGFVIPRPTYKFIGLLTCETTMNGRTFQSFYLTFRQVHNIKKIHLNATSPLKMVSGETLALMCTVTTGLNTRIQFIWDYPGKENRSASTTQKIDRTNPRVNKFYSVLVVDRVSTSDKGSYKCKVRSGPAVKEKKIKVIVYEKPFISGRCRKPCRTQATAGQRVYRFPIKVKAFPPPEVLWLKDGLPLTEISARYKVAGGRLTIRDVSEEDAGSYTMMLRLKRWNLYKNITLSLSVNVKPHICEKALFLQDLDLYPLGSKQTLSCTAYGIPLPRILWVWQPCAPNNSKAQCEIHSGTGSSIVLLDTEDNGNISSNNRGNVSGNRISSINERAKLVEGKYKTFSTLVVAESNVSGVYHCVASNKVGRDERNISFYITDIPNEFGFDVGTEQDVVPTEGDDLTLFCRANQFLYSKIACRFLSEDNRTAFQLSSPNQVKTGLYSIALYFTIKNVSQDQSGIYECAARNIITQEIDVIVLDCCLSNSLPHVSFEGIILGPGSRMLIIERVKEEDEGLYQCQASNRKGFVETSAYITVRGSTEKSNLELITLTCTCLAAALFWLLLTLLIRKLKKPSSAEIKNDYLSIIMDPDEVPLVEQCEYLPYDASKWEFPRDRLKLGKALGRGAFGKVVEASAFGINKSAMCKTVAVKMLKEGAIDSEYKALMSELKILIHIGNHLNVVNLLGACTRHGGPLLVIVEYCKYGNLSNYLKSKRNNFVLHKVTAHLVALLKVEKTHIEQTESKKQRLASVTSSESSTSSGFDEDKTVSDVEEEEEDADDLFHQPITMEDLISYSFQVARGMEFLALRKCIHRDLAARNVLLSENNVVKICDFGLARDIYKDPDYVRKGDARLPLKWMAPESIFDKVYNTQSDVWSFGVLLWEIFSLGASPYPGVQIDEDFCRRLKEGTRMRAPEYSTPDIYQTTLDCWHSDPKDRPTFSELVRRLGDLLQANVQQDGKDYIPLNTMVVSNSVHCSVPASVASCLRDGVENATFNSERTGSFG